MIGDDADLNLDDLDLIGSTGEEEPTAREVKKIEFEKTKTKIQQLRRHTATMSNEDMAEYAQLIDDAERLGCELSLAMFFQCAWSSLDSSPYNHNWHVDLIAANAEKLITGETRNLIVNVPPRTGKSSLLSVAFVAWVWCQSDKGPMSGPQVSFLCSSYAQSLAYDHSIKCRNLLMSPWYQKHWGKRFAMKDDRNAVGFFENDKGGYRIATSVGAGLTGLGAAAIIIDDPSNTVDVVSEAERNSVINWYSQSLSTRLNDPKTGIKLLVQQRQHENDLTGYILDSEPEMWEHVVLRMRYEGNPYLDYDPRSEEGELLWAARIPEDDVQRLEKTLGSVGTAGQLQQRPQTAGGGIIKAKDWRLFPPEGQEEEWKKDGVVCWPPFEFVVASCDLAFTEKQENDFSALTLWGIWYDRTGAPKIVVIYAWQDRLSFNPLVMRIGNNCRKFKPDILLIEAKAAGISAAQELQRVFGSGDWSTVLINPKGDKVSRAIAVQGLFEEGLIYAPDKEWAQMLIDTCASFPKGKHDDLVDSTTQALRYLRDNGLIRRREEQKQYVFEGLPRPGDSLADVAPYDV